jgi:hypothetical protein
MSDQMDDYYSEKELAILEKLWENHGYYIHKSFAYCQPLITWAILESEHTLTKPRIKVENLECLEVCADRTRTRNS